MGGGLEAHAFRSLCAKGRRKVERGWTKPKSTACCKEEREREE